MASLYKASGEIVEINPKNQNYFDFPNEINKIILDKNKEKSLLIIELLGDRYLIATTINKENPNRNKAVTEIYHRFSIKTTNSKEYIIGDAIICKPWELKKNNIYTYNDNKEKS